MENKIFDYRTALEGAIGNKLQGLLAPRQKYTGLLDFAKSDYAGDIGKGLLAQSGYTTMPTNLGASVGTAVSSADQLRTQRRASEFGELGAFADVLGTLTPKGSKTDDRWKQVQSYAGARDINLTEQEAKEIASNLGSGSTIRVTPDGLKYDILDIALQGYVNNQNNTNQNNINQNDIKQNDNNQNNTNNRLDTGLPELENELLNKKIGEITDDFNKNGWNESLAIVQQIENIFSPEGNIRGLGPLEGNIPPMFIGEEGRKNKAIFARLLNTTLKARSGAAVTPPELERLKEEFSAGGFKTDKDYRNAFGVFKRILNQTIQQATIGYDLEAFSEWENRGGIFQVSNKQNLKDKYNIQ